MLDKPLRQRDRGLADCAVLLSDRSAGTPDAEANEKLQKLGELLQFDAAAAAYLLAEYRLNGLLGEIYKILAEAVELDLGALEG